MKNKFNYDKQFGQVMKNKLFIIRLKAVVYGNHWSDIPFDTFYTHTHFNY
jgi:hypothetical protein